MAGGNGESTVSAKDVSDRQLIEVLIEAVTQISEQLADLREELLEKVDNISPPGSIFSVDEDEYV